MTAPPPTAQKDKPTPDARLTVLPSTPATSLLRVNNLQRQFLGFSLNVMLTTILFILIFVTASSWTLAVNKQFKFVQSAKTGFETGISPGTRPDTKWYWAFSGIMTIITIAASIGFGEAAHAVNKNVSITITNLLGTVLE